MRALALLMTLAAVGCSGSDAARVAVDAADPVDSSPDAGAGRPDAAAGGGGSDSAAPKSDPPLDAGTPTSAPMDRDAETQPSPDSGSPPFVDTDAGAAKVPQLEALPSCIESGFGFDQTAPERDGPVSIAFSAWLQPQGVDERAEIQVLNDQGDVDDSYNGTLSWTLPEGVELVSASQVVAGEAEATFRFTTLGDARVTAQLSGDARTGFADLIVYATQLPIWELEVDPDDLARIESNPESDEAIQGMLVVDGVPHATALRLHGASSRYFPKKSFRFELSEMGAVTGTYGKKLVLRAEYNDKSLLRNWLALRMFRANTRIPTSRSQLVHFRVNGRYYGVMHNVERVASRMLDEWGLATNGSLYEADPEDAFLNPGGNLTPVTPPEDYPHVYQHQAGAIDYTDLRAFIEETLALPDDMFANAIERELEVDDYIDYLAMMAAIQNIDHIRKNFYLYRDPLQARGWRVLPWDLDLTFGHLWSEENDVLEEEIATDADVFVGVQVPERGGFYNQLIDRLLTLPSYRARFLTRLDAMLSTGLTRSAAEAMLANAVCRATPDILADRQKRASNAEYESRVAEIGDFLDARFSYVQSLP
jgi:spore coat protein H